MRKGWMLLSLMLAACGGGPTGDVTVLLTAEDTITEGLDPGTELENIVDGWEVRFSKYIVAIGDVHLQRSADGQEAHDETIYVVDLAQLPASGITLTQFEALSAVQWDRFGYATAHPSAMAVRHDSVSQADFDAMVANEWSYYIEGTLSSPTGESCPPGGTCRAATSIAFRFGVDVDAGFGPCEAEDGLPGVVVTESGTSVAITLHGDHMFFDGFPSGAEIIERRAQWLANADTDGDDVVTAAELQAVEASALFPSSLYNLGGAPIPIEHGWDYVRAQLATQGHFQGEGECQWTFDGTMGGHQHEDGHDH